MPRACPDFTASNTTDALSDPCAWAITGIPLRSPQLVSCSTAAARNVSPAASSTDRPSRLNHCASLPIVVVLPGAVDADNQNHEGAPMCIDPQRLRNWPEQLDQLPAERFVQRHGVIQLFAFDPLRQRVHDALRRIDADIRAQQAALEFFQHSIVDRFPAQQKAADPTRKLAAGLREPAAQPAKKTSLGVRVVLAHNCSL